MAVAELSEITEQSTSEDVAAYAEQVAKEVAEERAGEPEKKGDAQIASEHANTKQPAHKETPAEKKSGRDDTAEVDDDSENAEVSDQGDDAGPEWFDDDLKAEITAYGIDEKELADYGSREEVERALRLFDKAALDAGRKAMAESETEQEATTRSKDGRFQKKEPEEEETERQSPKGEFTLPNEDMWDEDVAEGVKSVVSHFESRFAALESRFAEEAAIAEERTFDNFVDKLGHAELFGETGKETKEELQRRGDLIVAVKAQQIGLQQLGRPTDLDQSLVNRVARMVFAEELGKKDIKKRTRKITRQSNGRQGGGATRPSDPREDLRDEADRLYQELNRA